MPQTPGLIQSEEAEILFNLSAYCPVMTERAHNSIRRETHHLRLIAVFSYLGDYSLTLIHCTSRLDCSIRGADGEMQGGIETGVVREAKGEAVTGKTKMVRGCRVREATLLALQKGYFGASCSVECLDSLEYDGTALDGTLGLFSLQGEVCIYSWIQGELTK